MSDQVLYRKYRSGSFAEVVGQDHVVRTLTSAIASGRLSHAYLFTGPRGTGKTSVARLLARAVNCTGDPKPCGTCSMCLQALNSSLDVVEIDAASNRSIDSIRELRERVALAPTVGTHKVYIIDEVHMLTTEAFNALLKTLEEPPSHVIFILATTEVHKVPETIISRTQRLAFRPITDADLTSHLGSIAKAESISIEPEAIAIIARASRGGFRDAISMLDQLSSAGDAVISAQIVRELLGYSSQEELLSIAEAIVKRDTANGLTIAERLHTTGAAPAQTTLGLIELFRDTMRANAGVSSPGAVSSNVMAQASLHRLAIIIETLIETSRSMWPQLSLEAAIVKLTTDPEVSVNTADAPRPKPAQPIAPASPSHPAPTNAANHESTTPINPPETTSTPAPTNENGLSPELWPKVLVQLKSKNNSLGALLQMYQADFGVDEITVKARFNFHRDLFLKAANRTLIEAAATKVYGSPVKVHARTEEDGKAAARARKPKSDPNAELVSSALEILGGEVVD